MTRRLISVVPNVLSVLRIVLACCFWLVPTPWRLTAVVAGGVSDWLDGAIARRFHATSVAGGLLDAVADKLLTLSVLVTLAVDGDIAWWQVPLVLSRDLVVGALALYALLIRRADTFPHMRPKLAGKITTFAVFFWFVALLVPFPPAFTWSLFTLAAATSLVAGADYFVTFWRRPLEFRGRGTQRSAAPID